MPARLSRRRYKEIVSMLKELIADKKQPAGRRLQAGQTLLEVYARHDRTEAQKDARKRAVEGGTNDDATAEAQEAPQECSESAEEFLERIKGSRMDEAGDKDE